MGTPEEGVRGITNLHKVLNPRKTLGVHRGTRQRTAIELLGLKVTADHMALPCKSSPLTTAPLTRTATTTGSLFKLLEGIKE